MDNRKNRRWEAMDKSNTDLSVIIRHFEVHNRTEGKSYRTVGWYNEVLGLFCRWLNDQQRPTTIGAIDEMVIREFILDLQGRPGCKGSGTSSRASDSPGPLNWSSSRSPKRRSARSSPL